MDRLKAMTVFQKVADLGSFSAAGRELGMPLATVSRQVTELEKHLGSPLLTRTTRAVALTESGEAYLKSVRRILDDVDAAERQAAGEFHAPRGELVLTAPICFGQLHVLPVVRDFLAQYPEINVRLALSDRNLHMIDEHIDMAVRAGALPDSSLHATRIGEVRQVIVAAPKMLAAHGTPKTPDDLCRMPLIHFGFASAQALWDFRIDGKREERLFTPRLTVTTADAALWAAREGIGAVRVLSYQSAGSVSQGDLRVLLEDYEAETRPVHLLHANRAGLPLKTRIFLDFAREKLRERIKQI
ncbi:LysR family transcriptional regulator [Maricaulis sp.]|uniref:LysR family transcriptional regulator n=1 Tax=Maricaulis sp. TaxID=1486257 RepID=UPI0026079212|nr:LysR family transcriptional regulator [Maricaulis sp.]